MPQVSPPSSKCSVVLWLLVLGGLRWGWASELPSNSREILCGFSLDLSGSKTIGQIIINLVKHVNFWESPLLRVLGSCQQSWASTVVVVNSYHNGQAQWKCIERNVKLMASRFAGGTWGLILPRTRASCLLDKCCPLKPQPNPLLPLFW
jgi:hypothetical protein